MPLPLHIYTNAGITYDNIQLFEQSFVWDGASCQSGFKVYFLAPTHLASVFACYFGLGPFPDKNVILFRSKHTDLIKIVFEKK